MTVIAPILSPNIQLLVFLVGLMLSCAFVGILFYQLRRHIDSKFGSVTPLWEYTLKELRAIMRHPHEWAKEMDELMDEADLEPNVHMHPDRLNRYIILLHERVNIQADDKRFKDLRILEREAAAMTLLAMSFAREEVRNQLELSGIRLVGIHRPEGQNAGEASAPIN